MLISLPTHQLASSPSYKFVNLPNLSACQSINSPSPHLANSSTYKLISLPPHQLDISPSRKFINLQARQLTNPSIHHLPTSQTRQLANSSTKKLKSIIFVLQNRSDFIAILAKKLAVNWANWHYRQFFASLTRSIFKRKTCILHHFAVLDWLPPHYFLRSIILF